MGDLAGLTADQKDALVMFSEVTANARDQSSAIELMRACNWNTEQALQLHWASGDEGTSSAASSSAAPSQRPLIAAGNDANQQGMTEYLGGLGFIGKVLAPVWRVISVLITFLCSFIFGPWDALMGDGEASGAILSKSLNAQYGSQVTLPIFAQGSFMQALDTARKDVKLLVVYLHSEHSRYTQNFCTQVLSTDFTRMMLDENFLLWGGDIARMEAHHIAEMVHARQFPCFCVLLPANMEEIRVIGALHGDIKEDATVALLSKCLEEMEGHRAEIIARQEQHKEDRNLREEQNKEFEEALEMDRKLEEQRKAALAEQQEAERLETERRSTEDAQLARLEAERRAIEDRRRSMASKLAPPGPDATSTICVRLPAGQRIQRKFTAETTLADVYAWADCLPYLPEQDGKGLVVPQRFRLRTSFPPIRDITEMDSSIRELQLAGALVVLVEIDDD